MTDQWGTTRIGLEIPLVELTFKNVQKEGTIEGVWESSFGRLELRQENGDWVGTYPNGRCELKERDGVLEGRWFEGARSGRCRFKITRCGRFLQGTYGRSDGPLRLT